MSELTEIARRVVGSVWAGSLAGVLLAGCATGSGEVGPTAPDWEQEEAAPQSPATVEPAPVPAPASVAAPAAPAAAPNRPAEAWVPLERWCYATGLAGLRQVAVMPSPTYAVNTPGGGLVLRAGSGTVYWDGVDVRLGFPLQMIDDQPCLHALDLQKTLEPMIQKRFLGFLQATPRIIIDPGHGGADSGAKSVLGNGLEKHFTLDWAWRLGELLATNGWEVFLTRSTDVDMPLSNRVAFADAHQADIFLSLHFNSAAPNQEQAGLETYYLTPTGMYSSITRGYEDDPGLSFPNNAFDQQNLQLALLVHRALLPVNGRLDRGVRHARYLGVLRNQNRPAALVEGGYLSNPREARLIATPQYRQRLAEAVAGALTLR